MYNRTRNETPLTQQQMFIAAPSLFASAPHESRSEKYVFEPTMNVITELTKQGIYPIYAAQRKTKKQGYANFTKHLVIMREAPNGKTVSEYTPEILITNSHDGSTSRIAELGFFRMVCANGLILNEANMGKFSSSHINHNDDFIEGVFSVLATAKDTSTKIEAMKDRILSFDEAKIFAQAGMEIRWPKPPITAEKCVNTMRRYEDEGLSLWKVFNRVQEQLQRGGMRPAHQRGQRTITTRPVTSIDETIRINRELGQLATGYLN
jgi:hypothetical protein